MTFNGQTYESGLKLDSKGSVTFTTTETMNMTLVLSNVKGNNTVKVDGTNMSGEVIDNYYLVTVNNLQAGEHKILKGTAEGLLIYIGLHRTYKSRIRNLMGNIKRIVLTGGPCAGKTTALIKVIEHFNGLGYQVFTIPEVPTMFSQAGMNYLTDNKGLFYEGEKATLEIQLALEDKFMKMAEQCVKPTIIICDRGAMDISAYMKPEMWEEITAKVGTSTKQLRDERYDAVLHLVSAANGAEQFYTTSNNKERKEGLELARELDKKVINAWTGAPHLRVINNSEDFDKKLNRVLKEISSILELILPRRILWPSQDAR